MDERGKVERASLFSLLAEILRSRIRARLSTPTLADSAAAVTDDNDWGGAARSMVPRSLNASGLRPSRPKLTCLPDRPLVLLDWVAAMVPRTLPRPLTLRHTSVS